MLSAVQDHTRAGVSEAVWPGTIGAAAVSSTPAVGQEVRGHIHLEHLPNHHQDNANDLPVDSTMSWRVCGLHGKFCRTIIHRLLVSEKLHVTVQYLQSSVMSIAHYFTIHTTGNTTYIHERTEKWSTDAHRRQLFWPIWASSVQRSHIVTTCTCNIYKLPEPLADQKSIAAFKITALRLPCCFKSQPHSQALPHEKSEEGEVTLPHTAGEKSWTEAWERGYLKSRLSKTLDSRYAPEQARAGRFRHGIRHLNSQLHAGRDQREGKEPKQTQGEGNVHRLVV